MKIKQINGTVIATFPCGYVLSTKMPLTDMLERQLQRKYNEKMLKLGTEVEIQAKCEEWVIGTVTKLENLEYEITVKNPPKLQPNKYTFESNDILQHKLIK